MISSGIFVLPGIAFQRTGPAMVVAYAAAGLIALIGALSVIELATGMPKAGGDYFFITRSLGPLVGTISGLLSWFALSAKTAFAVYGLAVLLAATAGLPPVPVAVAIVVLFVAVNLLGAKSAVVVEVLLVVGLLGILIGFVIIGFPRIEPARFRPFLPGSWNTMASSVGFVFVSFGGLIKASSLAGEVRRPGRALPLGMLGAIVVVTGLYALSLVVTIGVVPAAELAGSPTPLARAAGILVGPWGFGVLGLAAGMAFVTTAHAGLLSASRYPLALSRDHLLPQVFRRVTPRGVPLVSLLLTAILVLAGSLTKIEILVTTASTIILASYLLNNVAVLVMRAGRLTSYRPTFRVPFTPVVQIIAMALFVFFIVDLGAAGLLVTGGLVVSSLAVYLIYGRRKHSGEFALLHVIERITNRAITGDHLEQELQAILHEKDEVHLDEVDHVMANATTLDLPAEASLNIAFQHIAENLAARLDTGTSGPDTTRLDPESIRGLLWERENESSTALSEFVAVPHLIVPGEGSFQLVCARSSTGVDFGADHPSIKAIFVLAGTRDNRSLHLRTLAALAQIAMDPAFESEWLAARKPERLREVLLLSDRRRTQKDRS